MKRCTGRIWIIAVLGLALSASAAGAASAGAGLDAGAKGAPSWLPPSGLLNTMTVHAKVRLPAGGYVAAVGSKLAAFKGDAIRGVTTVFNGPAPEMQFQLAVGSNSSTESGLTLRAYDAGTDTVHEIEGTLSFAADSTLGTIVAPYNYVALPAVVNAPPTATPAALQTATDLPLLIHLAGTDAEGDALTFRIETLPANGGLTGFSAATGEVTYRPAAGYVGTDSFTFAVTDGEAWSAAATVTVTVSSTTLVTIAVTGGNVSSIEWGAQAGATPGADVGIDHLAPMAGMDGRAVYFIPPLAGAPALKRDLRASLTGERWQIAVSAGGLPVTLSWDPAAVPPGNWHLWELAGPGGAAVPATAWRLTEHSALAPVPAGQQKHFALGLPDTLLLSGLTPATGLPTGGTSVTVTGSGFQAGAVVRFGALPALSVTRLSATTLAAVAPAQARGVVSVSVVNPDGGSVSLPSAFVYNTPPTAAAGGPYEYTAGDDRDVSLNGTASAAGDAGDTLTFAWDVDGDGAYDDAAGVSPVIPWATLAAWLDAGTLRYGEPNPVALQITDALGATSGSQTTLVAYRGEWSFTFTVQDGSEAHLTIGLAKAASDGLDALDRTAASPPAAAPLSLLAAAGQTFTTNYHAYDPASPPLYSGWLLHLRAGAAGPCVISWDAAALAGLRRGGLWLFEASPAANGGTPGADGRLQPGGLRCALAAQSSITVAAGETRFFRIAFGYLEQTLNLPAGWNLLSLPLAPRNAAVAALLAAGRGQVAGSVWAYDGSLGAYRRATEMQALHGYWAYVTADPVGPTASLALQGIPVSDADYPLAPAGTWQLAGVAQARPLEATPDLIGPAHWWNADTGAYGRLASGATLSPGRGYWFCVRQATALNLTPAP